MTCPAARSACLLACALVAALGCRPAEAPPTVSIGSLPRPFRSAAQERYFRGLAAYTRGDLREAVEELRGARRLDPRSRAIRVAFERAATELEGLPRGEERRP